MYEIQDGAQAGVQDTRCKLGGVRGTRYKAQDEGGSVQDTRYKIRDTKAEYEIRGTRYKVTIDTARDAERRPVAIQYDRNAE